MTVLLLTHRDGETTTMIAVLTPTFNRLHAALWRPRVAPPALPEVAFPLAHPPQPQPPRVPPQTGVQK